MERNRKYENIASNPKYPKFIMTSYIGYLDPRCFQICSSITKLTYQIIHLHVVEGYTMVIPVNVTSTIILKPIYSYLARIINVSEVTPLSEVTPFYGT